MVSSCATLRWALPGYGASIRVAICEELVCAATRTDLLKYCEGSSVLKKMGLMGDFLAGQRVGQTFKTAVPYAEVSGVADGML